MDKRGCDAWDRAFLGECRWKQGDGLQRWDPVTWRPHGAEKAFALPRANSVPQPGPQLRPRPQLLSLEMPWDSGPGPPRDGGMGRGLESSQVDFICRWL